ncbi:MAG TPA: zinc-binding dehydrogenase [Acidobacteriota bacterium]|nr:zinc-binding dehydrogenase [Acidobacteriota bacterium]
MRRVWKTSKAGSLSRLRLLEEEMKPLDSGSLRVRTRCCGLNFADLFALLGVYSATPEGAFVPGLEFSGRVEEVGAEVEGWSPGDRLYGVTRFGGYADRIDIEAGYCRPLPSGWSCAQGAAFPAQTLTAWYALRTLGEARAGQNVLVQSAAGGVGLQCLNICRNLNVRAIGCVGRPEKIPFLHKEGFEEVVVRRKETFQTDLRRILQDRPLHLALDAVGGWVQRQSYQLLAPTGRLVVFGAARFMPKGRRMNWIKTAWRYLRRFKVDPLNMIADNKSVMAFNLIWLWDRLDLMSALLEQIESLGLPPPHVGAQFPFEQARQALAHLQSGRSVGKVVLTLEDY